MNIVKRTVYHSFIWSLRIYRRLCLDFRVWGREHIPEGPKIFAMNHITCSDPFWLLPVLGEPVHIVTRLVDHFGLFAPVLDAFEQINALPENLENVVPEAVKYLQKGESILIAPEGDLYEPFQLGRFYPGVGKIYHRCPVPIVPIALVAPKRRMREIPRFRTILDGRVYRVVVLMRGTYCINVGEPWMPEPSAGSDKQQFAAIAQGLRERIAALAEDVRRNKFWL